MEFINWLAVFLLVVSILGLPAIGLLFRLGRYKMLLGLALAIDIAWVYLWERLKLGPAEVWWHAPAIAVLLVVWIAVAAVAGAMWVMDRRHTA